MLFLCSSHKSALFYITSPLHFSPFLTFVSFSYFCREDTLITPSWKWEVIYRSPVLYYEYYFTNKNTQLPPRRQACLLRTAIDTAHVELAALSERIAAREVCNQQCGLILLYLDFFCARPSFLNIFVCYSATLQYIGFHSLYPYLLLLFDSIHITASGEAKRPQAVYPFAQQFSFAQIKRSVGSVRFWSSGNLGIRAEHMLA